MFIKDFDISNIEPADYNPRQIDEDSFALLKKSIQLFGIVKPLIVNGDSNILTAGHQRTRAIKELGIKTAPVIVIDSVSRKDEIKFNLMHNSIETCDSAVIIKQINNCGFQYVNCTDINIIKNNRPTVVKESCELIVKYGAYGSCICDMDGNVIHNAEYAIACALTRTKLLVYASSTPELIKNYFDKNYGEYSYNKLSIMTENQTYCQMNRLRVNTESGKSFKSNLYEKIVLPKIKKDSHIIDFGAGMFDYVKMLQRMNYDILGYDPCYKLNMSDGISIKHIIEHIDSIDNKIKEKGLFDSVILDSVLNSTLPDYERHVLTTCNALCKSSGSVYIATRNLESVDAKLNMNKTESSERIIEFLDKNNYSVTFRSGVWTMQKFYDVNTLRNTLELYFGCVQVYRFGGSISLFAVCSKPKQFSIEQYRESLDAEFNMQYSNSYKHNRSNSLVDTIINRLEQRIYE